MKKRFSSRIVACFDFLLDILAYVSGGIILITMVGVCLNVIMRYFFNRPIVGADEVTGYLLLYVTFLGTAWLLKDEGHVAVDFIVLKLRPRKQIFLNVVTSMIGMIISAALVWYGSKVTWQSYITHAYMGTILEIPKAPILVVIPAGSCLLLIQFIRRAFANIRKLRSGNVGSAI